MKMSKIAVLFVSIFLAVTICRAQESIKSSPTADYPKLNSLQDRIVGLSRIWSEVKYNFVNIDHMEVDLDSLYEVTLPRVIEAQNDVEYYNILQSFLAKCNDGHTQVVRQTYEWNDLFDYTPCAIQEVNEKYYITRIRKNVGLDPILLYGEVIEAYGMPTLRCVKDSLFDGVSASTYQGRLMGASTKLMQGPKGTSFFGKVRRTNGEVVAVSVKKNGETTRTEQDEDWGIPFSYPNGRVELDWADRIAVLKINTFGSERVIKDIDSMANLIRSKNAKGLIIDLRRNGGGITPVAHHLQMYLTHADSIRTFGAQKRINDGYGRSQGNYRDEYKDFYLNRAYEQVPSMAIKVKDGIKPFDIPVVILVGAYTFSACEDFLVNIYECPDRPKIVGEPTGGSTGAPLMIPLPNGAMARVCTLRITYPYSGKPFVGTGIQPDLVVKPTIEDLIQGTDVVKEAALKLLR